MEGDQEELYQGGFPRHLELKIPDRAEQSASLQSLHAYPAICDDLRLVVHFRRSGGLSGVVGKKCIESIVMKYIPES